MENNDFEIIEKIKQLKSNGNIGWAKHLIPICKVYFEDQLPLSFIKIKIAELYQFDVSIHTLKSIRTKYRKSLSEQSSQPNLKYSATIVPQTGVSISDKKPISTNSGMLSTKEEKNQLLEKVIKDMADFDNKSSETRTELDDLIEWQQQQKLHNS